MTLNEKIKDSVQKTTGLRCFEGTPPDSVTGRFAYFFPLRSGAAKRYNEVAVFFVERPVFAPLDPERATVDCRYLALDWLNGLYAYSGLKFQEIISQNNIRDGFDGYGVGMRLVLVDEARHTGGGAEPKPKPKYLTFTPLQNNSTVGWTGTYPNLEYSIDGLIWTAFTEPVIVAAVDKVMFRNNGTAWTATNNSSHFTTTGSFDISGSIMSLVDPTLETTQISTTYCFRSLFRQCTGIVSAENLTLAENTHNYCYAGMFYGCTALESAPSLPSTSAASHCYNGMFMGCTALVNAPELPATTLAQNCYSQMFYGCTALETAPVLPATTLAQNCYASMFAECSSLETAPELPATTLADNCYTYMFRACTSLENAPELPVTTLVTNCYNSMFIGCTSLEHIKVSFTEWLSTATEYWVENVAASGTFECPDGLSIVYDKDHIPTGWRVVKPTMYNVLATSSDQTMGSVSGGGSYAVGDTVTLTATPVEGYNFVNWTVNGVEVSTSDTYTFTVSQAVIVQGNFEEAATGYLTFTALQDNSSVGWYSSTYPNLEYSTDGSTWTAFTSPVSVNTGGKVMFRNNGTAWVMSSFYANQFKTTGSFNLSGNIMSLVDATMTTTTIPISNCFQYLFSENTIVDSSDLVLPATTLTLGCYRSMFQKCTSLVSAPELPATTLNDECYASMFNLCSSLTIIPHILPATTLAPSCYQGTFANCPSITTAPELPATILQQYCYQNMFIRCTALETAPELPATVLAKYCYNQMFYGCTSLNYIKCLATNINATNCTYNWVNGVSATGTFVKDVSMSNWTTGDSGIPSGWIVQNYGEPFSFTALEDNSSVGWTGTYPNLEYSTDGSTWTAFTEPVSVNTGDKVMFRNNGTAWATSNADSHFTTTGKFNLSDRIVSLIDATLTTQTISTQWCFNSLFRECNIVSSNGVVFPKLTGQNACSSMFMNCSLLTDIPDMRNVYGVYACYSMFSGCTSLTSVTLMGDLSANCYEHMFSGCTSLTSAYLLNGAWARTGIYNEMFSNCTSMNYIEVSFQSVFSGAFPTFNWLYNVSPTGTIVSPYTGWTMDSASGVPVGWNLVNPS